MTNLVQMGNAQFKVVYIINDDYDGQIFKGKDTITWKAKDWLKFDWFGKVVGRFSWISADNVNFIDWIRFKILCAILVQDNAPWILDLYWHIIISVNIDCLLSSTNWSGAYSLLFRVRVLRLKFLQAHIHSQVSFLLVISYQEHLEMLENWISIPISVIFSFYGHYFKGSFLVVTNVTKRAFRSLITWKYTNPISIFVTSLLENMEILYNYPPLITFVTPKFCS